MSQTISDKTLAEEFFKACQDALSLVRPGMVDPYGVMDIAEAIQGIIDADGIDAHMDLKPYFDAINSPDSDEDMDLEEDAALASKVIGYLFETRQTPGFDFSKLDNLEPDENDSGLDWNI